MSEADDGTTLAVESNEYTISPKGDDGIKLQFDVLMGRVGNEYVFLDYVFDSDQSDDDSLSGAVGTSMVPLSESEIERRREEYKDPEWSPIAHIWSEMNDGKNPENYEEEFVEWVEQEMRYGDPLVYDSSYSGKYGDDVIEHCDMSESEIGDDGYAIECVSGGRMFNRAHREFDIIYRPDLLMVARYVEENGINFL